MTTFEIQLEAPKHEELPHELKNRLSASKKEKTLQEIDDKLQNAAAKRQELKQVRVPAKDRIALTQGRRESFEKAQGLKVQAQLGLRMTAAEERRLNMRQQHLQKVRTHNNRVVERRQNLSQENQSAKIQLDQRLVAAEERRNNQQKQVLDKVQNHLKMVAERRENLSANQGAKNQLDERLVAAEERRNNQQKQVIEKVQTHLKRVAERRDNLSADMESAKALLGKKLSAAEERRNQQLTKFQERLQNHNRKVMEIRRNVSSEKVEAKQSLCMQLEQKMLKAQSKRDELLTKIRTTAAAAAAPKGQAPSQE